MQLPNFLIIGGVASGTSFLSSALSNHPQIYLPKVHRPEPNFFHYTYKYEKGIQWYSKSWFHEVHGEKAIGERSSLILTNELALFRLHKELPQIKIIVCLRNPIERAWANYRFTTLEGLESFSFNKAIKTEVQRTSKLKDKWIEVEPYSYIKRSMYSLYLKKIFELFDDSNVLILKSESLSEEFDKNIESVLSFLQVDTSIKLERPKNFASPSIKDKAIQSKLRGYFGDRFPSIIESIRTESLDKYEVKSNKDNDMLELLKSNLKFKKDSLSTKNRLILAKIFENELIELQKLIPFSVKDWV